MADESRWWPQIMGHVLRYGVDKTGRVERTRIGRLTFCTNGEHDLKYRAYYKPILGGPSNRIYWGDDLEECRDRVAEYFRTREMFPVDQE